MSANGSTKAQKPRFRRRVLQVGRREMDRRGVFYELLTHYAQALVGFIVQSTACNAVHSVEQRLARWLLMARDRMETDQFQLTQEFAAMICVVRSRQSNSR